MRKILIISDKNNWAFSSIASSIIKYNDINIKLSHLSLKQDIDSIRKTYKNYDFYFVIGWQNLEKLRFLDPAKTLTGVHSHQSFDNRQTTPGKDTSPNAQTIQLLKNYRAVNTVSERLHVLLEKCAVKNTYTPNGVDCELFYRKYTPKDFVVCSVSAIKNEWNKGVSSIIKPACQIVNVPLIHSETTPHDRMIDFYNKSMCYICASKSEGMSLGVLEAAACGCVIVSTKCGDIDKLVTDGKNGFLIERSIDALSNILKILKSDSDLLNKLSQRMLVDIKNWDWRIRVRPWLEFMRENT